MNGTSVKWCVFAVIAMTFLSLLPQLRLWHARGSQWHGAYATVDGDEFLYSAYINSLIDGRPRRNDPFSGRDDHPKAPLPESTFSIQFIPPLVIATLAKAFGASASTAFIVLIGAAGLLASLGVFWLLLSVSTDSRLAAIGTLFVLCFGSMAAGEGLLGLFLGADVSTLGLPFLRRYQPAATFFIFFVFCALTWRALTTENNRKGRIYAGLAGLTLAVLVFSYIYLWTAAASWLVCVCLLWLWFKRANRRRSVEVLIIVSGMLGLALLPYLYLVFNRAANLDETQTMTLTHRPDPFRIPEILGALVLVLIIIGVRRKRINWDNPRVIVIASFALLPFVLFNQQILTGRSMQPFHYVDFVANYAVLVSLVIVADIFLLPVSPQVWLLTAALILLWGAIEVDLPARTRLTSDIFNDEAVPVLRRLSELSEKDGTFLNLRNEGKTSTLVFAPNLAILRLLPTWTAQGTFVGLGGLDFGSASSKEQKVYTYHYYRGTDRAQFAELLNDRTDDAFMNYYTRSAVFGHERVLPKLGFDPKPIQPGEVDEQVRVYESYVSSFSRGEALKNPITYLIVLPEDDYDFSHIDQWYERTAMERVGDYAIYRLALRSD